MPINRSRRLRLAAGAAMAAISACLCGGAQAQIALPDSVESAPLAQDVFSTGLLTEANGALTPQLWDGANPRQLEFLLENLPTRPASPALGEAMRRTLLSPGSAPETAADSLGGKKLIALASAGFIEEAATVASISNAGRGDRWVNKAESVGHFLSGEIQSACRLGENLSSGREDPYWIKLRVLCYALAGESDAAELSLGVLREQFGVSDEEEILLSAAASGLAPKTPPAATTPFLYAVTRALKLPISPGLINEADGGVLIAVSDDANLDPATRIAAGQRATAMGVMSAEKFAGLIDRFDFDIDALSAAGDAARERGNDPLTDALLYHSVKNMNAPEFLRDKAKRIALALSLADSFHRAYALSVLYADEIAGLEGAVLAPQEAAQFAQARMAVGDSAGAGRWLTAMAGPVQSVEALPEEDAIVFIELVNLLFTLDPQTASQIARAANVSLLNGFVETESDFDEAGDPVLSAQVLEAAFDAAVEGRAGQAGLAALAASEATSGPSKDVIVGQSLKAAGMGDLQRRYRFERAWAARFPAPELFGVAAPEGDVDGGSADEDGFGPRIKPGRDG